MRAVFLFQIQIKDEIKARSFDEANENSALIWKWNYINRRVR